MKTLLRVVPLVALGALSALGALGAAATLAACGSFDATPMSVQDASIESSAMVDGGADVVQPPAGCDVNADAKDAPKCVVNDFGVFVDAASGADGNAGTKESPVKSLTAALGKLGGKSRIYVCEGTYAEHVKLSSAMSASLYGGFACGSWGYTGTKAKVTPKDPGFALEISQVSDAVTVADVSFTTAAGTAASPSSIAALVNASNRVTLRRTESLSKNRQRA